MAHMTFALTARCWRRAGKDCLTIGEMLELAPLRVRLMPVIQGL